MKNGNLYCHHTINTESKPLSNTYKSTNRYHTYVYVYIYVLLFDRGHVYVVEMKFNDSFVLDICIIVA